MGRKKAIAMAVLIVCLLTAWLSPARPQLAELAGLRDISAPQSGQLQVHFLAVGNADAILLRTADTAILIDAGENDDENAVVNYLHRQGVHALDLAIASHADADHVGGMDAVIRQVDTKAVWLGFDQDTSPDAARLFAAMTDRDIRPETPALYSEHGIGELTVQVLGPVPQAETENDRSLAVRVLFGDVAFLFCGDASSEIEQQWIADGADLAAGVIKVGHHGSATSCGDALLQAANPSIAVISCGKDNEHGHPDATVLNRLLARNITVWRTDVVGTIVLTTDGVTVWQ